MKEKLEKQRIRDEILAPEPVSEMDTKVYSGYLAAQSSNSKSEVELQEEQQKAKESQAKKEEAQKKHLAEVQE